SEALSREIGYRHGIAEALCLLGRMAASLGDYAAARARCEESLVIGSEVGNNLNIAVYLEGLANVVAVQGECLWATRLWGAAEALREAMGAPIPPVYRAEYERAVATARSRLGEKSFTDAWAEGQSLTLEQVLSARGPVTIPTSIPIESVSTPSAKQAITYPDGLTAREVEVLRL